MPAARQLQLFMLLWQQQLRSLGEGCRTARMARAKAPALRLPGCYNPACTSLAGASESGMPLKWCTGCMIAR
jgi:hypothetical protein